MQQLRGLICSSSESAGVTDDLRGSRRSSAAPCGEGLRHTSLVNYALYQVGWFACVLGASWRRPGVGLSIALVLIGAHVVLSSERHVPQALAARGGGGSAGVAEVVSHAGTLTGRAYQAISCCMVAGAACDCRETPRRLN